MKNFSKIIFCDSIEALNYFSNRGMLKTALVLTKSPSLLSLKKDNILNIEDNLEESDRIKFRNNSELLIKSFFNKIKDYNDGKHSIFLTAKFSAFLFYVFNAMLIKEEYISKKFIIASPRVKNKILEEAVTTSFESILKEHKNCEIIKIPIRVTKERSARGESKINIFNRLKSVGFNGLIWFVINLLSKYKFWRKNNKVGTIFYNELVRGISISYMLHNFRTVVNYKNHINFFNKNNIISDTNNHVNNLCDLSSTVLEEAFKDIKPIIIKNNLKKLWHEILTNEIHNYENYYTAADNFLKHNKSLKVLVTGYIEPVKAAALYQTCKSKNVSLITCQHGITRELIDKPMLKAINFENTFSDHFFCFNQYGKYITEKSFFHTFNKKIYIVGLPKDYFYQKLFNKPLKYNSILYVSTFLLSGGRPNILAAPSDFSMVKWEKELINNVFTKIKSKLDFKPYPAFRYADDDEVIKSIKNHNNIRLVGAYKDLRYIINNYKLIITSGATSTVSWCVQTTKPLIYIDRKGPSKLSQKAKVDFEGAFFVFSDETLGWEKLLIEFINQPLKNIIAEWECKYDKRKTIVKEYFGEKQNMVGVNAIEEIIKQ